MNPLLDMGRDLTHTARGWHFRQTVSGYTRISKYFRTKEDAIEAIRAGGYPEPLIQMLEEHDHVPSMMIGGGQVVSPGLELDRVLVNIGKYRGGVSGEIAQRMSAVISSIHDPERTLFHEEE